MPSPVDRNTALLEIITEGARAVMLDRAVYAECNQHLTGECADLRRKLRAAEDRVSVLQQELDQERARRVNQPGEAEAVDALREIEYNATHGNSSMPEVRFTDALAEYRHTIDRAVREQVAQEIVEWARSGIFVPNGDYEGEAREFAARVARGAR